MAVVFQHQPHPRIAAREGHAPPRTTDALDSLNGRLALLLTRAVGTMWCAYAFTVLALVALPEALASGDLLPFVGGDKDGSRGWTFSKRNVFRMEPNL